MNKQRLLSGHETELLTNEELRKINEDLVKYKSGYVRILPDGGLYPATAKRFLDRFYNMELRPDDVFIISFPKSGTTWMQEILWLMLRNPDLDPNNEEMKEPLWVRSMDFCIDMIFSNQEEAKTGMDSIVEKFSRVCPGKKKEEDMVIQIAESQPSPRVIKTHFPLDLLNKDLLKKCKVVYVARNPKDMMVSLYHYIRVIRSRNYQGSLEKLARIVMKGDFPYCPYWRHVLQAWRQRDNPNLHFTTYEDMKDDIMGELRKLNKFLGKNLRRSNSRRLPSSPASRP